tara:strand:+ start:886 stop:1734 length:849 start_codon:yes stop_codon:yes gene_type:complete
MINLNCKIEKNTSPFPYVKITNFLEKDFYLGLEKNFPKVNEFKNSSSSIKRMDFDTTYGDQLYNKLIFKNTFFKLFHNYIYSTEFINYFLNIFREDIKNETQLGFLSEDVSNLEINPQPYEMGAIISKNEIKKEKKKFIYPRLDIGTGVEGYGKNSGGKGIHVDNPQRLISILFYLGGYKQINGGEHRIWKKNSSGDLEIHESIEPEKNLLIAGLQNNLAFHDVNPVKSIDGSRNTFYLAISCSSSVWKDVKSNEFNLKYNKNRVKLNIYQKINKFFFKYIS